MRRRFGLLLMTTIFLLVVSSAWSQSQSQGDTGTSDDTQVQPGPKPAFTYPDMAPSLDFLSQAAENSSITLGIGGGIGYFYQNSDTSGASSSRTLLRVRPSIEIRQFKPKLSWSLAYAGGLQSYVQSSASNVNSNMFSQLGTANILWQASQHWQVQVKDNFVYSSDPFESYGISEGVPTINNPNPSYYYTVARYTLNNAFMDLTGKLTAHDTIDFSGTSYLRRTTSADLATVPFYNVITYGGRVSYNHQVSARLTLGAGYNYQSLDFGHGVQRTGAQTITLSGQYLIHPNMSISLWAGPEYSTTKSIVEPFPGLPFFETLHTSLLSSAFGANFGWQGTRDSFRADISRQVSDGGGILATTQTYRASATYRRQFRPRWDGQFGATYWNNDSITLSSRKFWYAILNVGITHEISRSLNARLDYSYSKQDLTNIVIGNPRANYNRIEFTIQYNWNHPLGR